ncbi:hypothetical protein E2562_020738 [Oryza meyeriana var. granulata]|uniref:Uncharacterized protein n=1 Tax=Oryza meyeriana var. granulata TaxID=110450 RepID=A0A6G1EN60_9ORYZ|nr:hypothetical protein E2562_020738 [Oryza meyeriana var. granulata]
MPEHVDKLQVSINLVEEVRENAARNAATKAWYDSKLAPRHFIPDDMVLRRALNPRKLQKKWEGPFVVI